jgi:hypothetical protein
MPGDAVYGFAFIAIAAWIGLIYVVKFRPSGSSPVSRRRRWSPMSRPRRSWPVSPPRRDYRPPSPLEKMLAPDLSDPGQQLNVVMAASFERRTPLSSGEYKVFKIIEADIVAAHRGYRVFAQTSLGEILASPSKDAFRSINSKRVDILIIDPWGWPEVAVEYQGSGHYQGTAAARDAVKKEALRKAGVRYIEVSESDSPTQIRSRVRQQLGWETVGS